MQSTGSEIELPSTWVVADHVSFQVLTVVNIKTTVFFGMMWHRIDRYHHYEEPASSFQLYTSFP